MKKQLKLKFATLLCVAVVLLAAAAESFAQSQVYVYPTQLYRFRISNTNLGYLLTPSYSEGVSHGYTHEKTVGSIYVPPAGFVPSTPNLVPIHQWTVIQNGRAYTYYSYVYFNAPSNYTYDGVRGYMFAPTLQSITLSPFPGFPQTYLLHRLRAYYSESKGFWFGTGDPLATNPVTYINENPPNNSGFVFQGITATYLPSPYGTCPGCTPPPPSLLVEKEGDGLAENHDNRMPFVSQ
jgi:hypothetical protein